MGKGVCQCQRVSRGLTGSKPSIHKVNEFVSAVGGKCCMLPTATAAAAAAVSLSKDRIQSFADLVCLRCVAFSVGERRLDVLASG